MERDLHGGDDLENDIFHLACKACCIFFLTVLSVYKTFHSIFISEGVNLELLFTLISSFCFANNVCPHKLGLNLIL